MGETLLVGLFYLTTTILADVTDSLRISAGPGLDAHPITSLMGLDETLHAECANSGRIHRFTFIWYGVGGI